MPHSSRSLILLLILPVLVPLLPTGQAAPEQGEEIVIYRDTFGIPNIFARTDEGVAYGLGYAQAEDRLDELLKQYRRAEGTLAEAFGPEYLRHDYRQRVWQHRAIAEANYPRLSAPVRALIEAYQAGVKRYMKEHPDEVPAWAPKIEPWQVVALGRYIIWGWPEGDGADDLKRAGIQPDPIPPRASNQWVIAASRTAAGHPLALIDPHLSWYGQFRFYEARLYGNKIQMAGVGIVGLPLLSLGHSTHASFAMTTGGPDAADVYEEEVNPDNPRQYRYQGKWREMTVREEMIRVKKGDKWEEKRFEILYTHHGPVVARRGNKAYAMKLPYFDQFRLIEQCHAMITARSLDEIKKALGMLQLMEQNVMVATVAGDLFYVRNGRVPIRPRGYDWTRPVPGDSAASEWLGIHPFKDLVHLENPWQGYMHNCNVSPEHMMKFCPLVPERYREHPYLYNADNPLHQRAAMVLELLHGNTRVTVDQARAIALSPQVYGADRWQARLVQAWKKAGGKAELRPLYESIVRWNRLADADSTGAVAYLFWKKHLGSRVLRADRAGQPPVEVSDEQVLKALAEGAQELEAQYGKKPVCWGDIFRVGREGSRRTWPVAGGSVPGLATPRAIGFRPQADGRTYLGRSGQTAVILVQLSNPPRSWTLLPLGNSDRPASPHFDDQAEKLFSKGKMKPTYFLDKARLLENVESRRTLIRPTTR